MSIIVLTDKSRLKSIMLAKDRPKCRSLISIRFRLRSQGLCLNFEAVLPTSDIFLTRIVECRNSSSHSVYYPVRLAVLLPTVRRFRRTRALSLECSRSAQAIRRPVALHRIPMTLDSQVVAHLLSMLISRSTTRPPPAFTASSAETLRLLVLKTISQRTGCLRIHFHSLIKLMGFLGLPTTSLSSLFLIKILPTPSRQRSSPSQHRMHFRDLYSNVTTAAYLPKLVHDNYARPFDKRNTCNSAQSLCPSR